MKLNLNSIVKVKLTDEGNKILQEKIDLVHKHLPGVAFTLYKPDYDGCIEFQLWEFMNLFGSYMSMTDDLIVEDNTITITKFIGELDGTTS